MANEKDKLLPPYLAFKTFRSAIQDLRVHGLPKTLDRTAWQTKSGTDQSQIMNSLKFLELIDDQGNTLETLKELVEAKEDSDFERTFLGALMASAYGAVFQLDLENATPKQIEDAIGSYGITGLLKERAVRFFLKAASHAGVKLSTRLTGKLRDRGSDDKEANAETGEAGAGAPPEHLKPNGKTRKRTRRTAPPPAPPTGQLERANAMKTIDLPAVGGTLTLSATFNPLQLKGDERALVYFIVDKMDEFEQKTKPAKD